MESSVKKKKIKHLIVDTSAFIKNAALQEIGENIITVPEVVNEIKSKRQLRRLVVLPYDLQVKDAFPENIKFVNEFSKKTGDFASLSATDATVIALTYQLEKEINGSNHLNSVPLHKATIDPFNSVPEDLTNVVGFHLPKKNYTDSRTTPPCLSKKSVGSLDSDESDADRSEEYDDARDELEPESDANEFSIDNGKIMEDKFNSKTAHLKNPNYLEEDEDSDEINYNGCDDDDDEDWITPVNVKSVKSKIANELVEDLDGVTVACLTTDYAMQNVLKQIGLHVISLDGKLINQLRTFILRCYGCFKTTSVMTKVFCPNCGNKTLKKVAVSLNEDGTQHLHINFKKPLTARGKRYSLPRPRGGKHSNNPILCEDQPMPQQKPTRLSRTKNNPLNDDYIAGYSPFVMRDVTSKSAMLGIKPHIELKHRMRRNPNESRKHKK